MNTTEKDNKEFENKTKKKSSLVARTSMFFVMAVFFAIFLNFAIFYNYDIFKNEKLKISFFIICLIQIILVTSLMSYELVNSFFEKKQMWFKILYLIFMNVLAYIPLYSEFTFLIDILTNVFNVSFSEKIPAIWSWLPSIAFLVIFTSLIIGFYFLDKDSEHSRLKDFILFTIYTLIILFGVKTFIRLIFVTGVSEASLSGLITLVWVWLIVILNDTFAFIGGSLFGKHKLAPTISPKKTIEGAISGIVVSIAFGFTTAILLFYLADQKFWVFNNLSTEPAITITLYFFMSLLIAIIGIVGDLLFSYLKRYLNKKDFSNILPGHGGLLDRFDSLLFTMFILYLLVSFM